MSWFENAFGSEDSEAGASGTNPTAMKAAFMEGEKEAHDFYKRLVEKAEKYAAKGQHMEGTVLMFVAAMRTMGVLKQGVMTYMEKNPGKDNPVLRTWQVLETALMSGSIEDGIVALRKWQEENE